MTVGEGHLASPHDSSPNNVCGSPRPCFAPETWGANAAQTVPTLDGQSACNEAAKGGAPVIWVSHLSHTPWILSPALAQSAPQRSMPRLPVS